MAPKKKTNNSLIAAIIFASVAISGSLIFLGLQLTSGTTAASISSLVDEGIQSYIAKQQETQTTLIKLDQDRYEEVNRNDHLQGNAKATISIIEYSDFQCPYCKGFHTIGYALLDKYGDDLNWAYRHFPLQSHPQAIPAAITSECIASLAKPSDFWEFSNAVFALDGNFTPSDLKEIALGFGINSEDYDECYTDGSIRDAIKADMETAIKASIGGTPGTILVNNNTGEALRISGLLDQEQYEGLIDELLQK